MPSPGDTRSDLMLMVWCCREVPGARDGSSVGTFRLLTLGCEGGRSEAGSPCTPRRGAQGGERLS